MTPAAKLALLIGLLAGLVLGLYVGWEVRPAPQANTTAASLHADYKADLAVMVAEIFIADGDSAAAETRLSLLGPPAAVLPEAFATALLQDRTPADLDSLVALAMALNVQLP